MAELLNRELRAANTGGGDKGWAIINSNGPHGDVFVATGMTEADAMACLGALNVQRGRFFIMSGGSMLYYDEEYNQYRPVSGG